MGTAMSIRMFRRFIAEACHGMVKNGLMTVASLFIVTACLFIFGVFMLVTMNINYLGEQLSNQCQIQVYVTNEAKYGGKIQNISDSLKQIPEVQDVSFETGEKTLENFKEGLTEQELVSFEGLPSDVISDSFKITLTDISAAQAVVDKASGIEGVERVENRQDIMNIVKSITDGIRHVSIWIIVLFAFISLFIISNTIKLTVHSRGREINIMKYVGATDAYIRWPFIIEGILTGVLAAVITFFITKFAYSGVLSALSNSESLSMIIKLRAFSEIWTTILVSYVIGGGLIGAFGSGISVRRYLKV